MWSPLDHLERFVMLKKGTETPFTGKYNLHFEKGVYRCKQCHKPLFESDSKFDSQDGWPAFDEVIPGSVLEQKTSANEQTEVSCINCKGHLGYVKNGTTFTQKNTHYSVNSAALDFVAN